MHFINRLNSFGMIDSYIVISHTSSISNNSFKNIVSLGEFANGQYLNIPSIRHIVNPGSLFKNNIEHFYNYSWKRTEV